MEHLASQLPSTIVGWLGIITLIIVGAVAVWGVIDKTMRDRRKEALEAADGLINTLKEQIETLTGRVDDLEEEQELHIKQLTELKATNELLTKILQGRDETTLAFQRQMLEAVKIGSETNSIVRNTESQIGKLTEAIGSLVNVLEHKK